MQYLFPSIHTHTTKEKRKTLYKKVVDAILTNLNNLPKINSEE